MERTILVASEGMIFTDGEIYGTKIYLAAGISQENFYEISLEEYEKQEIEEEESNGQDL